MAHLFVDLPAGNEPVYLFDAAGKKYRQVLWGDWLEVDPADDGVSQMVPVRWSWTDPDPAKRKLLTIERRFTAATRPLEIIFVDVGQGDGSVLITPERDANERIIVIDAGEGDHMCDFLTGRFQSYRKKSNFSAAVITHPDKDHYYGFKKIFESKAITFDMLYHSGLVERPGGAKWEFVGRKVKDPASGDSFVEDLMLTDAGMRAAFDPAVAGAGEFTATIRAGIANNAIKTFEILSTQHGRQEGGKAWMPGFAPSDNRGYSIEILGPWMERNAADEPRLRVLGSYGETKNGHSVLLRLNYKNFRVLFGGDLNLRAEKFLLTRYAGLKDWPPLEDRQTMVDAARPHFRAEIMKVCHHGSSDVTDEFLEAVSPSAFVISSGDEEGHVHPRPDLLGRLGKKGRGSSPVLLSTELQRSTRDREDAKRVDKLTKAVRALRKTPTDEGRDAIIAEIEALGGSNVDVDGAIYVKTDGDRLIAAFKKETGSATDKWFWFSYLVRDGRLIRDGETAE